MFSKVVSLVSKKVLKTKTMKRVNVNAYQVALLFERGVYQRMLKEGSYWLWPWEKVMVYDVTKQFVAPVELTFYCRMKHLQTSCR